MPVLDAQQLQKAFGDRIVLRDVRLTIRTGERIGLVGNNGSGKSTLARVLAGLEEPDGGALSLRRGARVAYLEQEPVLPEAASIRDVVSGALESWSRARDRHEALTSQLGADLGGSGRGGRAPRRLGATSRSGIDAHEPRSPRSRGSRRCSSNPSPSPAPTSCG